MDFSSSWKKCKFRFSVFVWEENFQWLGVLIIFFSCVEWIWRIFILRISLVRFIFSIRNLIRIWNWISFRLHLIDFLSDNLLYYFSFLKFPNPSFLQTPVAHKHNLNNWSARPDDIYFHVFNLSVKKNNNLSMILFCMN